MSFVSVNTPPVKSRMNWIEPEVSQLDVRETATKPTSGGDGQRRYADCTRS